MRIAVFDLDGTITRRDTFLPYLRGWLRRHPRPGYRQARRRRRSSLHADRSGSRPLEVRSASRLHVGRDHAMRCNAGPRNSSQDSATRNFVRVPWPRSPVTARLAIDSFCCRRASISMCRTSGAASVSRRRLCTGVAWRDGRLDGSLTTANRRAERETPLHRDRCGTAFLVPASRPMATPVRSRSHDGRRGTAAGKCRTPAALCGAETGYSLGGMA